jgi:preprotein translocase subunit SecB
MNGIYNIWPYWREYVQTTTSRLGLPPLTLPVLTGESLQKLYQEEEKEKQDEHEEGKKSSESDARPEGSGTVSG